MIRDVGAGKTYATIAAAYAAAVAGDEIVIYGAGPWQENLTITKANLTLRGSVAREPVLEGTGTGNVVTVSANDVTVKDLSFVGAIDPATSKPFKSGGVSVSAGKSGVTVDNCYFKYFKYQGVGSRDDAASSRPYPSNLTVKNCLVEKCTKGVSLAGDGLVVEDNEIRNLQLFASDCDYMRVFGSAIRVRRNWCHGSMELVGGSHVDCVQYYRTVSGGQTLDDLIVENNLFEDCHQGMMFSGGCSNVTVRFNVFRNCLSWGLDYHDVVNANVHNNAFIAMATHGVGFRSGTTGFVKNNIFYNAGSSYFFDDATGHESGHNLIYSTGGTVSAHEDWDASDILNQNPLLSNPNGAASAWADLAVLFAVQAGSPAINAGEGGVDIGAVDYEAPPIQHTVTFATDGTTGASLTGSASQTVAEGTSCSAVTANAPDGWRFKDWQSTGEAFSSANPLTVQNVTTDLTLTACFAQVQRGMVPLLEKFRALVLAQSSIVALVGDRVYGGALPRAFSEKIDCPKAISIRRSAFSPPKNSPIVQGLQFEVHCWGESGVEAEAVARTVHSAFNKKTKMSAAGHEWNGLLVETFGENAQHEDLGFEYVTVTVSCTTKVE